MCADRVALLDRGKETGAGDGTSRGGIGCSPDERIGLDAMLIRVCYEDVRTEGGEKISTINPLVSKTLDGYNNFSRSLSVRVFSTALAVLEALTSVDKREVLEKDDAGLAIGGVSDCPRGRGMPPRCGDVGTLDGVLPGWCSVKLSSCCEVAHVSEPNILTRWRYHAPWLAAPAARLGESRAA